MAGNRSQLDGASRASGGASHLSRMSDTRRSKLEAIQKREHLKGMLVTKFRNKYANDDQISIKSFIDNEVQRFLNSNRLTETNL